MDVVALAACSRGMRLTCTELVDLAPNDYRCVFSRAGTLGLSRCDCPGLAELGALCKRMSRIVFMCTHKCSGEEEFMRVASAAEKLLRRSVGGSQCMFETVFFDSEDVARLFDIWECFSTRSLPSDWRRSWVVTELARESRLCIELAITMTGVKLRAYHEPNGLHNFIEMSIHTDATLITSPGGDLASHRTTFNGLVHLRQLNVTADLRDAMLTGVGLTVMWTTRVEFRQPFTLYAYA